MDKNVPWFVQPIVSPMKFFVQEMNYQMDAKKMIIVIQKELTTMETYAQDIALKIVRKKKWDARYQMIQLPAVM